MVVLLALPQPSALLGSEVKTTSSNSSTGSSSSNNNACFNTYTATSSARAGLNARVIAVWKRRPRQANDKLSSVESSALRVEYLEFTTSRDSQLQAHNVQSTIHKYKYEHESGLCSSASLETCFSPHSISRLPVIHREPQRRGTQRILQPARLSTIPVGSAYNCRSFLPRC